MLGKRSNPSNEEKEEEKKKAREAAERARRSAVGHVGAGYGAGGHAITYGSDISSGIRNGNAGVNFAIDHERGQVHKQ